MKNSEFRAYTFIQNSLKELGWNAKNPSFNNTGQIYTQHEALQNETLKNALKRKVPENVVKLDNGLWWIIEAKSGHGELETAVNEAKDYAKMLNDNVKDSCLFISGVAGNKEDSFLVETHYLHNNNWHTVQINGYKTTGFLTKEIIEKIINTKNYSITEEVVADELFLEKANKINLILHNGAINKRNRAKVIASLLLALAEDEYLKISKVPTTLIKDINTRVHSILSKYDKDNFAQEIALNLPTSKDNHIKHRQALVDTIQELKNLNIRSAINSGRDVLGQFYEVFLKYANDAKEIGIVLTPRHITEFGVECIDIKYNDFVFDPTCGTGGFLVSAFDYVKQKATEEQINEFKTNHIYGIEQDSEIVGLALVNMIFRGDGKSNIYEGNALNNKFKKINNEYKRIDLLTQSDKGEAFISKTVMNPPFAIKNEEEYKFVDHALSQMIGGGLLFAVIPNSIITSANDMKGEITWRKELLNRHTVKAVVKLSDELFCPIASKGTYAIIIEAHKPHNFDKNVLFAIMDDGFTMKKAKRIVSDNLPSNIALITEKIKEFIVLDRKIENIEKVIGLSKLNTNDNTFDLAPESYLQSTSDFDQTFEITTNLLQAFINQNKHKSKQNKQEDIKDTQIFDISEFFTEIKRGKCPPINSLKEGNIPVITTTESDNGIVGYYDIPQNIIDNNCITISANGSSCCAFYHPYNFTANADVLVCKLRKKYDILHFKIFLCTAIRSSAWKFTYYRKCSNKKLLKDVKIIMPMKKGLIDYDYIESKVKDSVGFDLLKQYLC
jgi:type I restriction-modification system DNA methylase subunit